jgi:hypothetical protein
MYGTAELKKLDTKSIPFDYSLLAQMVLPEFLENYAMELDSFMANLLAERSEGKPIPYFW